MHISKDLSAEYLFLDISLILCLLCLIIQIQILVKLLLNFIFLLFLLFWLNSLCSSASCLELEFTISNFSSLLVGSCGIDLSTTKD